MSYTNVALAAVNLAVEKKKSVDEAWRLAAEITFPHSKDSQTKSCPKSSFLGLCSMGKVKGIKESDYTKSEDNKLYALTALDILAANRNQHFAPTELLRAVLKKLNIKTKTHNSQMNVLLALWENDLINKLNPNER